MNRILNFYNNIKSIFNYKKGWSIMITTINGMREANFGEMISCYRYAPNKINNELFDNLRIFTDENGDYWFRSSVIASIMGYTNPWKAVRVHIPDKYKKRVENLSRLNDSFSRLNGNEDKLKDDKINIKDIREEWSKFYDYLFRGLP